jgi:hypothetical protein
MAAGFTYIYGDERLREINYQRLLIADGKKLAISNGMGAFLLHGFDIKDFSISHGYYEGSFAEVTLRSIGRMEQVSHEQVERMFQNPNNMSIDDLIKLINHKMEKRKS